MSTAYTYLYVWDWEIKFIIGSFMTGFCSALQKNLSTSKKLCLLEQTTMSLFESEMFLDYAHFSLVLL